MNSMVIERSFEITLKMRHLLHDVTVPLTQIRDLYFRQASSLKFSFEDMVRAEYERLK